MKMKISAFAVLFCVMSTWLFSQEEHPPDAPDFIPEIETAFDIETTIQAPQEDSVFIINSFVFNVKGYTRPDALIRAGDFIKGEKIKGIANLETYIQDKTQTLVNERVLKDNVRITYTIEEPLENGKYPVNLVVYVEDTWNIIAIPRPQYSTSSGFDITIKARDYNFLGTMRSLRLDLGYRYDEKGRTFFNFMLDSVLPFKAFNLDWRLNLDNYFDYRPGMEQPYYYKNVTGISVDLPFGPTTATIGFNESLTLNEENSDSLKRQYKDMFDTELGNFQDGIYMSSNPYLSWAIPTGIVMGYYGDLVYTPRISTTFNHAFPQWPLDETRRGPFLSFGHSLGFGRVDWIGNFLKGVDVGIGNSYSYNFFNARNDLQPWGTNLRITGKGHFTFDDMFGISTRLMYRQWFFDTYSDSAGDVLRGIVDRNVFADYMISLNLDLSIKFLKFRPSNWLDNHKLRIFNFDFHLGPFLDAAIYRDPEFESKFSDANFTFKNMLVSAGAEAIIFPQFFRSLFLRVSFGMNLSNLANMDMKKYGIDRTIRSYELFIGTELHY
ncbi:MAG: hypothetical protein FWD36_05020 [Treponema sp.]|nr:hypothetical protein [Treponema sp.]